MKPTPESTRKNIDEFLDDYDIFDDAIQSRSSYRRRYIDAVDRVALYGIYVSTR
jgi:hypothetical protein